VFAAAIGVNRPVERDVGRSIARNDRPRCLDGDLGAQRCDAVELPDGVEPIAFEIAGERVEPAAEQISRRTAAALEGSGWHGAA